MKFCGSEWGCGKAELLAVFSVLGRLLLPNRLAFLQEASWTTLGVPSNFVPTSQIFALWARNFIKTRNSVNSCGLIILIDIS